MGEIASIISLTFGAMSLPASFVFFILARKEAKNNRDILDNINKAIREWQSKIMETAIEIMESDPKTVANKMLSEQRKAESLFMNNLSERIKYIVENLKPNEESQGQFASLKLLLETFLSFKKLSKTDIPPEILANIIKEQDKNQPAKTKSDQSQSKKD